jgi:hypothetical protein
MQIGYVERNPIFDMSFDDPAAQQLNDQQLENLDMEQVTCSICYVNTLIPELDSHIIIKGERCGHVFDASCFLAYIEKKYILEEMGGNFLHWLVPAIKCPYCNQFGGWYIPHGEKLIPDGVRVYGYHKGQTAFDDRSTIYLENWITCPVLFMGLQCMLQADRPNEAVDLPAEYRVEGILGIVRGILQAKVKSYFEAAAPLVDCSICKKRNMFIY